jgi:hypothetical protein
LEAPTPAQLNHGGRGEERRRKKKGKRVGGRKKEK